MRVSSPKQLYKFDRPREKLQEKGADALTNLELLQAIIGSGVKGRHVGEVALEVEGLLKPPLRALAIDELMKIKGMSLARAATLVAALALSRRLQDKTSYLVKQCNDVLPLVQAYLHKKQEHLICITLNGAGTVIAQREVSVGILTSTLVHPREIFADAVTDRAASIFLVHNHPSGSPIPSGDDIQVTKVIADAGRILGISLDDHIIVTPNAGHYSFREAGIL